MLRFVLRRLGLTLLTLLGIATLVFVMIQLIPGDPARTAAGRTASAEQVEAVRERLGLDESLPVQYGRYLGRLVQGDLGTSVFTFRPVTTDLAEVLPSSLELVLAAMLLNLLVAVPIGVVAAVHRGRAADLAARLVVLLGAGVPIFWLGLLLQYLFGGRLAWLPLAGQTSFGIEVPRVTGMITVDALLAGDPVAYADAVSHLFLPAVTLAAPFVAVVARTLRSTLVGVLDTDFVVVARAKGASSWRVVVRHGLRNALIPASTIIGLQLGWMLGSTVLVEAIFGRVGIGAYATTAVLQSDTFAVIAVVLVIGAMFTLANLAVDTLQLLLDPRLRPSAGGRA